MFSYGCDMRACVCVQILKSEVVRFSNNSKYSFPYITNHRPYISVRLVVLRCSRVRDDFRGESINFPNRFHAASGHVVFSRSKRYIVCSRVTAFRENPYYTPYVIIFSLRKRVCPLILKYNKHRFQTGPVHTAVYTRMQREICSINARARVF